MPYIKQIKRDTLDSVIDSLHKALVELEVDDESNNMEGNLNYTITRLLRMCYGQSYGEINDAMGMLQCVMLEHYRTVAVPYENQKIYENGDVDVNLPSERLSEVVVRKTDNDCTDDSGC